MAGRRKVDTSAMFKTMTGRNDSADQERNRSVAVPAEDPPAEVLEEAVDLVPEKESEEEPAQIHAETKPKKANTTGKTPQKEKTKSEKKKDVNPKDLQSKKLGFYLTPRVYEALKLHAAVNMLGTHNDSQIVNKALTAYLAYEIEVMRGIDENLSNDQRLHAAVRKLYQEEHNGNRN